MSADALRDFKVKVLADQELQERLAGIAGADDFVDTVVAIGAEHGFAFEPDDVRRLIDEQSEDVELSQSDLAAVAGGAVSYGGSILCGYCGSQSGTSSRGSML